LDTTSNNSKSDWHCIRPTRLRVAALWAACRTAEVLQFARGNRWDEGFVILMYHRVADEVPGVEAPTMNVTPERLRSQLSGLLAMGYECWSLDRLVEARRAGVAIPSNVFAITFDDGFENNYVNAWPVLKELNLPATIFVATQYLDSEVPFPFDDWSAAGSAKGPRCGWRPMSTRQCEELVADGLVTLGAHTHSHEKFLGRAGDFRRDMRKCLDVLRERFGIEHPTFAFPYGYKSPELVESAKHLGVSCCLSTRARRVLPGESEFEWGRIWVDAQDTPSMLAAKMGWYPKIAELGKPLVATMDRLVRKARRGVRDPLVAPANVELVGACKEITSP
jgi:peptidoglycan/xylan/chitin deacetylase (PgdA/CDA1 family)